MKKRFFIFLCSLLIFAFSCSDDGKNNLLYQYHSPEEIESFLDEVALKYPNITSLDTVGYSTDGRAIHAIVISDKDFPASTMADPEPRVRLVGGIHGNEKVTTEVLIRMIEYLVYNYKIDAAIKELIDNRYIVIIPVLNPDGLVAGTRYNSRGVDLNR
ncbi:MAG TPA: M14 family zinc carboxypeptidase, partial [Spirochaetota bacterium]|nr:M14 family zinc carboxypeptidase [Spirochaetota bacterium]